MLYKNRKKFSKLSHKTGKYFCKLNKNPNVWTLLSFITAVMTAFFLVRNDFLFGSVFLFITIILDFVDGSVARFAKRVTKKGAYLIDRYTEGIIIISLFFAHIPDYIFPIKFLLAVYLFGSLVTTYAKSAAVEKQIGEICGGILERAERVFLLFLGVVFSNINVLYLSFVILLLAVLSNITALQRIYIAIKRA